MEFQQTEIRARKKDVKRIVFSILRDPAYDLHSKSLKQLSKRVERKLELPKGYLANEKWTARIKEFVLDFTNGLIAADEDESDLIARANHMSAPASSTKFSKLETERILEIANDYIETNDLSKEDFVQELQEVFSCSFRLICTVTS